MIVPLPQLSLWQHLEHMCAKMIQHLMHFNANTQCAFIYISGTEENVSNMLVSLYLE